MANQPRISTQTAILIGSVIIAVGLFLGLRRAPAPSPSAPVGVEAPRAPAPTTAEEPARPAPALPVVEPSVIQEQVEAALAKHKKKLTDTCLAASLAKKPEPKRVTYVLSYTFGADGKQIARGMTESRENSRSDVTQCVSTTLPPLEIPPPDRTMALDVKLELP